MKETIEKLEKEKKLLKDRLLDIERAITSLQTVCCHTYEDGKTAFEYESSGHNFEQYKCMICGKTEWR